MLLGAARNEKREAKALTLTDVHEIRMCERASIMTWQLSHMCVEGEGVAGSVGERRETPILPVCIARTQLPV